MNVKDNLLAALLCPECRADEEVVCPRDKDMKCMHCGAELCALHGIRHLQQVHIISLKWRGFLKEAPP